MTKTHPPRRPGRPEVGGRVSTALGTQRLARVDAAATSAGLSRAEAIRRALDAGLPALDANERWHEEGA